MSSSVGEALNEVLLQPLCTELIHSHGLESTSVHATARKHSTHASCKRIDTFGGPAEKKVRSIGISVWVDLCCQRSTPKDTGAGGLPH